MSGDWAWEEADKISKGPLTHGAVVRSERVLYASLGNVQNHVRRAHRNALAVIGFLAIPKADAANQDSPTFRRQLTHSTLLHILSSLEPHMRRPRVTLWLGEGPRNDCVFVQKPHRSRSHGGFKYLEVAQVQAFLNFEDELRPYPCALVRWFYVNKYIDHHPHELAF
ncbi:hypothetical protein BDN72DRAFT_904324 [Pluteus cervinus]|uniref:Uncharacterized protein n=1 Tax=Pluteus cervinus TaxID=181527 RepID=A0ACD3A6K8_9AGAR|nr:hypothetical protein BDN72DRAFT_904324 [Pluteus cervinus]